MLINESGLVRCIKRAYKSAGYAVATEGDCMTIYTEQWYIQCKRAAIPRKVLGHYRGTHGDDPGHGACVHRKGRRTTANYARCGGG